MPKLEKIVRYKGQSSSATGTRADVSGVLEAVDHGLLIGLTDDDHPQYTAKAHDESISGDWTFTGAVDLSGATTSLDCAAPDANSVNVSASTEGSNTTYARSDHTHNLDESITPTWTAAHTFASTMTTRTLQPQATDTYDFGTSSLWYRQMFVSQINAAIFAEEQISLLGGWLYVSHDAGSFAVEVGASDTTIDFGKAMTPNDFVIVKAYDKSDTIKTEYIQVGTLVTGTEYNVTRDLAAAHGTDPNWAEGTPFAVLGYDGDGRIELNAYDTPRIQIFEQGTTYNDTTEVLRIGDMNGAFGSDSAGEWGFGVGDYSGGNFLTYNTQDGFAMKSGSGDLWIDSDGITLDVPSAGADVSAYKFDSSGTIIGGMYAYENAGVRMIQIENTAASGDYATTQLIATGDSGSSSIQIRALDTYNYLYMSGSFCMMDCNIVFIEDNENGKMTAGLTINQADADNEILALKSSDIAHGVTDRAETDTYGHFMKADHATGGLLIRGFSEDERGLCLTGVAPTDDTGKSTGANAYIQLYSQKKSGTNVGSPGTNANLVAFTSYGTTRFLFDTEGSAHADVEWTTFDEHDDVALLGEIESSLRKWQDDAVKDQFGSWLVDNRHELEQLNLVHFDRDNPGHVMLNTTRLLMLLTGACRQMGQRLDAAERALLP